MLQFTTLVSKDIGIIKSEFVAKTQFLCMNNSLKENIYYSIKLWGGDFELKFF